MAAGHEHEEADVLIIFGITGDLAKKMTLRSLYRLERRKLLNCPIVGVAGQDWTVQQLREHARESIETAGEQIDDRVFERFAARLSYIGGDFNDAGLYERLRDAVEGYHTRVFYLEIPPSLFGPVVAHLDEAKLLEGARVVVEKPFGHDLASARELSAELHKHLQENQLMRIDHFLGKLGLEEILYLRFANSMLEPVWNRNYVSCVQITLAEDFGVEDRGHFYDPVGALRDVVVNHLMQFLAVAAMEAPAAADAETIKACKFAVFRSVDDADPHHYVRGQYEGYREIDGVAPDSETETYAALRLEINSWRWAGVPFFIRAGKEMAATVTELRLVFKKPPRLAFMRQPGRSPQPSQLIVRADPTTGISIVLDAHRADHDGAREIELNMEFAHEGGEGPTPYEVLLHAALIGDSSEFAREDAVEECWRIIQPLLDSPPPVISYPKGSWGPPEANQLTTHYGGWQTPWTSD